MVSPYVQGEHRLSSLHKCLPKGERLVRFHICCATNDSPLTNTTYRTWHQKLRFIYSKNKLIWPEHKQITVSMDSRGIHGLRQVSMLWRLKKTAVFQRTPYFARKLMCSYHKKITSYHFWRRRVRDRYYRMERMRPESASKYRSGAIRSRFWTQAANEWRMFSNSNDFLWLEIHCCDVMNIRGQTQRTLFTGCRVLELLFPFELFIPNRNPITWKPMEWLSSPIINGSNFMNFAQNWKNKFH